MHAALLESPGGPLRLYDDVEIRSPRAGEVRVRVSHCGVCHSDLSIVDGTFPSPLPILLGHEAAGVVDAVGEGVVGLDVGDHVILTPIPPCGACYWCLRGEPGVCANAAGILTNTFPDGTTGLSRGDDTVYRGVGVGAFAEHVVTLASGAVRISREVPLDVACVIGCAVQTGVGAVLNTARVEAGATVLVMGLGGIGLSIVQGACLAGASRVHEVTGVGADYAFDAVGRSALIAAGVAATRPGGTTVCVGAAPIDEAITIMPAALFTVQEKKVMGCALGSANSLRDVPRLVALWQSGRLDLEALVTSRRPLADINAAFDDLRASRGIRTVLDCG
jgi:Zn-dependent alcohol dehydrogenase